MSPLSRPNDSMPADFAPRMSALLAEMRRNMDGVTAEAMYNAGVRGLLNYGVGIPAIRRIAREAGKDHQFAKFLYRQQVRELRMAAVSVAEPERVTADELAFWLEGSPATELLDELAMQLISRTLQPVLDAVVGQWLEDGDPAARYAAMMSLARAREYDKGRTLAAMAAAVGESPDDMRLAHGAVTLAASVAAADGSCIRQIRGIAAALADSGPAGRHFAEEIDWMIA